MPKDWLRYEELDAGDEVSVELTENGDLLLKAAKAEREPKGGGDAEK